MSDQASPPRRSSGERPVFFDDPAIDQLYSIVLALTAEVSATRDRADALERLLESRGVLPRTDVTGYRPDATAEAERAAARQEMIERVFRILATGRQPLSPATGMPQYERTLAELNRE